MSLFTVVISCWISSQGVFKEVARFEHVPGDHTRTKDGLFRVQKGHKIYAYPTSICMFTAEKENYKFK